MCTGQALVIKELKAFLVLMAREFDVGERYGEVDKGNGTPDFVGTIFANTVNLAGTIDLSLNSCFLSNLSPSLYSVVVDEYRELDRNDVLGPPPASTSP